MGISRRARGVPLHASFAKRGRSFKYFTINFYTKNSSQLLTIFFLVCFIQKLARIIGQAMALLAYPAPPALYVVSFRDYATSLVMKS